MFILYLCEHALGQGSHIASGGCPGGSTPKIRASPGISKGGACPFRRMVMRGSEKTEREGRLLFAFSQKAEKFIPADARRPDKPSSNVRRNSVIYRNDERTQHSVFFINPVACRLPDKFKATKEKNTFQNFPAKRGYARHAAPAPQNFAGMYSSR